MSEAIRSSLIESARQVRRSEALAKEVAALEADEFLPRSVVIVAPTSRSARQASFRPPVEVAGEATLVLVEQLGAVDARRLGKRVGHFGIEEMWSLDEALATYLGLTHL